MKVKTFTIIIILFLSLSKCYSQIKTLNSGIIFQFSAFEKSNPIYNIGYAKYKQNNTGRNYISYHFEIGYSAQNNIDYVIPSFTYNFFNYFSKSSSSRIVLGIRISDIIFNNNNDIRIAPVLGYNIRNSLTFYYTYNYPLSNDNYEGKFGLYSAGIICPLFPFYKKESSTPMK